MNKEQYNKREPSLTNNFNKQAIKVWVDASYQSKKKPTGVGIIITDKDQKILEEHSLCIENSVSSFDAEFKAAIYALNLPSIENANILEIHGDCSGVVTFLNAANDQYAFEDKSAKRKNMANEARELVKENKNLTAIYNSDKGKSLESQLMRRAHYLAKCALRGKPLDQCAFLIEQRLPYGQIA
jgi:ribonuclease HI